MDGTDMIETKEYAAMLYWLAEEIDSGGETAEIPIDIDVWMGTKKALTAATAIGLATASLQQQLTAALAENEALRQQLADMTKQRNDVLAALGGAANYIDNLGGTSQGYRQAIAAVRGAA
jgi:hypothetical protein